MPTRLADDLAEVGVEARMRAVHVGAEEVDELAARLLVSTGVEHDVVTDRAAVSQHDPSGGVLDDEWLAGLELRELVHRALDLRRLDLVERRVGALHERLAGQRVRMDFAVRVLLVEEERRLGLVLAHPQVAHRDRELALDVDRIAAVRVVERVRLGEMLVGLPVDGVAVRAIRTSK